MTSGVFHSIPIDSIFVEREKRQRRTLANIDELAASINRLGLIHPIVVTRDHILKAGERRLSACKQIGWTHISAQYVDELDEIELQLLEFEENVARVDLTWQERNSFIAKYYELYKNLHPDASDTEVAKRLNIDQSTISKHLTVAADPSVKDSDTWSTAARRAVANKERAAAQSSIHTMIESSYTQPILNESFHDWAPSYRGPKFNVIHVDFPYGIHSNESAQSAVGALGGYTDDLNTYLSLIKTLAINLDNFCALHAHMIFWFSPNLYTLTWENLKLLDGFVFDDTPLIWGKGSMGIAPDVVRRPRRVYESAFFGWRGSAQTIALRANMVVDQPSVRRLHPHEKSQAALTHFLSMIVNEHSAVFDPTAGSGSALRAAKTLKASHILGLEINKEFCDVANLALREQSDGDSGDEGPLDS